MPRSLWTGSLSFGLVNVPVQLVTAVQDVGFRFRQLNSKTHRPIEVRRFCSEEDREVAYEEIAHGYELDDGNQVIITDEDLAAVEPRKTRTIDIDSFVELADVDPIYFDHPYFLVPIGESEGTLRAYQLLVEVMSSTDRAALGRFVMRTKEYLVLVRVRDGRLALTTLLWHDEVRESKGIAPGGKAKPDKTCVEQTVALIEALSVDWDPSRYEDEYRKRVADVIARKKKGGTIKAPAAEKEPAPTPDLMAALEKTLAEMKGGGGGKASAAGSGGRDELEGMTKQELAQRAADEGVEGRSKMTKDELVDALAG
ncbi:MAG TPA: Ku protein [Solirubrobacteraceae bacterium]|nr:Ku protein [Solirubrobacteraceae bacterium]